MMVQCPAPMAKKWAKKWSVSLATHPAAYKENRSMNGPSSRIMTGQARGARLALSGISR
jgi:hypothetical protein